MRVLISSMLVSVIVSFVVAQASVFYEHGFTFNRIVLFRPLLPLGQPTVKTFDTTPLFKGVGGINHAK